MGSDGNSTGLMADKFVNYIAAFLMAGGVGIIGSLIPFLLLCLARESDDQIDKAMADTVNKDASCSRASAGFENELIVPVSCNEDDESIINHL